jgi:hypothetical protein
MLGVYVQSLVHLVSAQTWYVPSLVMLSGVTPLAQLAKQVASELQPSMQLVSVSQPLDALQAEASFAHELCAQDRHAFVSKLEPVEPPLDPFRLTHRLLRHSRPALHVPLA